MINGAHVIIYSKDVDADRAFFRDVLHFPAVDAGRGWLIFALPPAELAMHPAEENESHELYLMCPDLKAVLASLQANHVRFDALTEARWGTIVHVDLPSGGRIGLYQPKHPTALSLWTR
jgi:catechol 2,3-dioxygenase-like lactoylglutathione lyase family enzyme